MCVCVCGGGGGGGGEYNRLVDKVVNTWDEFQTTAIKKAANSTNKC